MKKELFEKISALCPARENVSMAEHTSFRCGRDAAIFAEPADELQLAGLLALLRSEGVPHIFLGNGSNVLFASYYDGAVVKIGRAFSGIERDGCFITAGAGAPLSRVSRFAASEGLSGMEGACGIPGSLGGAVFMNAGAYGFEMKQVLRSVRLMAPDGSVFERDAEELELGYRHSALMDSGELVLSARMELVPGERSEIEAVMDDLSARRVSKQPVDLPSAGSFFKRPEGYFAGKLIEDCGLKGVSVGGAQVSPLHAGFIVNTGDADVSDVIKLMHIVQESVMHRFGVMLEPEVRIIG